MQMRYNASVRCLDAQSFEEGCEGGSTWMIELDSGERMHASKVIMASGGMSYPKVRILCTNCALSTLNWHDSTSCHSICEHSAGCSRVDEYCQR